MLHMGCAILKEQHSCLRLEGPSLFITILYCMSFEHQNEEEQYL